MTDRRALGRRGLAAAGLAISLVAAAPRHSAHPLIQQGHVLAVQRCSRCHAVEPSGRSPNPAAPPFRTLGRRYPVESLDEALAEGILVGHADMPGTPWEPIDIERFIAYLKSINPTEALSR